MSLMCALRRHSFVVGSGSPESLKSVRNALMILNRTRGFKVAATLSAAALVFAGTQGIASAQTDSLSTAGLGDISSSEGESGSVAAYGSSPEAGSLQRPVNKDGAGSIDFGSAEDATQSLGKSVQLGDSTGVDISNPAPGTGSVDTTGSDLLGEPTIGSLADENSPVTSIGRVLGTTQGITTESDLGILIPIVIIGGAVAAVAALGPTLRIPGLPTGLPLTPPQNNAPVAEETPVPGPETPNGRG